MRPLMSNSEWKAVLLLVPHDVGGVPSVDVSRWQRPSSPLQLVGCGLDPDQARPHLLKERQNIPALQLPTDDDVASRSDAMHLKDRLRKIETDRNDRFHAPLPVNRDRPSGDHVTGHLRAAWGAVHSITSGPYGQWSRHQTASRLRATMPS